MITREEIDNAEKKLVKQTSYIRIDNEERQIVEIFNCAAEKGEENYDIVIVATLPANYDFNGKDAKSCQGDLSASEYYEEHDFSRIEDEEKLRKIIHIIENPQAEDVMIVWLLGELP